MDEKTPTSHEFAQSLVAEEFARRLVALEAPVHAAEPGDGPALRAVNKLCAPLSRLAGTEGFKALVLRALVLAKAHAPTLNDLSVLPDGSIRAEYEYASNERSSAVEADREALLAHLLGLLIEFVGVALTLQLLRSAWPSATWTHDGFVEKETQR